MTETRQTVRIGMVRFLNTAPIHHVWKETQTPSVWEMVEGVPTELNDAMLAGALDLGFVSSILCGLYPEKFRIMADLSISASGPVGSVFLFSRRDPEKLDRAPIIVSDQSRTSVALLKIIMEEFFHVTPRYVTGNAMDEADAVLAIGDQALRLSLSGAYPLQLDLGDIWHRKTERPFVFSVCAVREPFWRERQDLVRQIGRVLVRCRQDGAGRLTEISEKAAQQVSMNRERCFAYLKAMEYDLDPGKQEALTMFFQLLIDRREIPVTALPLRLTDQ